LSKIVKPVIIVRPERLQKMIDVSGRKLATGSWNVLRYQPKEPQNSSPEQSSVFGFSGWNWISQRVFRQLLRKPHASPKQNADGINLTPGSQRKYSLLQNYCINP
jgi:hypothetical protein